MTADAPSDTPQSKGQASTTEPPEMDLGDAADDEDPTERPTIKISTDQRATVNEAEQALARIGGIYVRGRQLVGVYRDRSAPEWLRRPNGTPVISGIPSEQLRERIGAAATWVRVNREGNETRSMVPAWVVRTLMDRQQWSFPSLEGISDAPVLRSDGTIHDVTGYDPTTRILYDPCGVTWPPIPALPTRDDAARAFEDLLEPFDDFPFVAQSDRSATAALILSVVARGAIDGCVPMFMVSAPVPGAGKGLLGDGAAMIATGHPAPKMAAAGDDEMRKRLFAIALESPQIVCLDNVEGRLGGAALAMALTAGVVTDRVLGETATRTASLRCVFLATGNNVQLVGDLGRRVVPIDIDPRTEHPEDREGFRQPDLLGYVARERPRLLVAAMTILRAYVIAGRPAHDRAPKGSYVPWDRLIRGAIIWLGAADPLAGVARIRDAGDEDLDRLREFLRAWHDEIGDRDASASDVLKSAGDEGPLRDAIAAYSRNGKVDARQLGYTLRRLRGRIADGKVLVRSESSVGHRTWKVNSLRDERDTRDGSSPSRIEVEVVPAGAASPDGPKPSRPSRVSRTADEPGSAGCDDCGATMRAPGVPGCLCSLTTPDLEDGEVAL